VSLKTHLNKWPGNVALDKFPSVLCFQLNEQQKVKVVRVSGTDSTVKFGLAAVQISTALLVKVSVFRYLV